MSRMSYGRRRRPRSAWRKFLDYLLTAAILALIGLIALRLERVETRRLGSTATVVNDGDSLTLGEQRIRLSGIDAPEYDQICQRGGVDYQCGREARRMLTSMVSGKQVACEGWETDRYGRLLAVCRVGSTDLNRRQVEEGWAVAYGNYWDAEDVARAAKKGLWAGSFERPRDWRDQHGGLAENQHDYLGAALNWLRQIFGFS